MRIGLVFALLAIGIVLLQFTQNYKVTPPFLLSCVYRSHHG